MSEFGRILIAGTNSGSGKTTITVALIAALKARGVPIASFKCGPDYIDPMFHRRALGVPSHNLDPFFCPPNRLRTLLSEQGAASLSIIEGVMGYFDGLGTTSQHSSYDVARSTGTPVVLVVNAKGMAASLGALLQGFTAFREQSGIAGVILNQVPARMAGFFEPIIQESGLIPLGCFPKSDSIDLPSRNLGLVTADEIHDIEQVITELAQIAADSIDLAAFLHLAASATPLDPFSPTEATPNTPLPKIRIAVAKDAAFCFIYAETLELWEKLGAEIVFFSPIEDHALPADISGLYLPGGYPENHLPALSKNSSLLSEVKSRIESGLPTIAECGGFMYLHDTVDGHHLVGAIEADSWQTSRLVRFGYTTLTAEFDNLLCAAGEKLPVHEFHYCESSDPGSDFLAVKASTGASYPAVHASKTLYGGFPHLYLPAIPAAAERFISKARQYHQAQRELRTTLENSEFSGPISEAMDQL